MKSDIRNIRYVYKSGAFGDPSKEGRWIYGRRPDGKTVGCRKVTHDNGNVSVVSKDFATDFSAAEWEVMEKEGSVISEILADIGMQQACNKILDERK